MLTVSDVPLQEGNTKAINGAGTANILSSDKAVEDMSYAPGTSSV